MMPADEMVKCEHCGYFVADWLIREHIECCHPGSLPASEPIEPVCRKPILMGYTACNFCGLVITKRNLDCHIESEHPTVRCPRCRMAISRSDYQVHLLKHIASDSTKGLPFSDDQGDGPAYYFDSEGRRQDQKRGQDKGERHRCARLVAISKSAHWVIDRGQGANAFRSGTAASCRNGFRPRVLAVPTQPLRNSLVCRLARWMPRPANDLRLRPSLGRARGRDHRCGLATAQIERAIDREAALTRSEAVSPAGTGCPLADPPADRGRGAAFARGRASSRHSWSQPRSPASSGSRLSPPRPVQRGQRRHLRLLRYLQTDDGPNQEADDCG